MMKNQGTIILITAVGMYLLSMSCVADEPTMNGANRAGFVRIAEDASRMFTQYNVRTNPDLGHEQSWFGIVYSSSYDDIMFTGYDASF